MTTYNVQCRCGYREEQVASDAKAQTLADVHLVLTMRRAYQHTTKITAQRESVTRWQMNAPRKGLNRLLGRFA